MKIRHAGDAELDKVCDILTSEFFNDPILKFAFTNPDRQRRGEAMRHFFSVYVNLARKYGGSLLVENDAGVLVYFRPEAMEITDEESEMLNNQLRQGCGSDYAAIAALMDGLNHYHPRTPPHYYAFALAVQSSYRGREVVKELFNKLNTIVDQDNFPCYAECTTFSTRTLLRRFGYRDAGPALRIEGFSELFPIWREPQQTELKLGKLASRI